MTGDGDGRVTLRASRRGLRGRGFIRKTLRLTKFSLFRPMILEPYLKIKLIIIIIIMKSELEL